MEFLHRMNRVAEMFEGVVLPEDANFPVRTRPSLVEIGGDRSAVQIDRLVAGSFRQILDAPV